MAEDRQQFFSPELIPPGTRIACQIEYDGRQFNGWQSQPHLNVRTVQDILEQALQKVADHPLRVHCAGRTDTGVHGYGQVVHFDAPVQRSSKAWVMGTNASLPADVRVHWAVPVADDFHARFSALSRRYRYVIANTAVRPALLSGLVTWQRFTLDAQNMQSAGEHLLGERDFSAFRAAACQSATPMRNVQALQVSRSGDTVTVDIRANAFLHHMVRNIVGALLLVGSGRKPGEWIAQLMEEGDRTRAADTAPADGLYLVEVEYPGHFGLPAIGPGPRFFV